MKQKLNDVLRPLGLQKPEILVFYKLLAYDHATVSTLSRETKIPRTSLYTILETLQKRELARVITVGKHKEWQATSPEELHTIVARSFTAVENAMPDLIQRHGYKSLHKKGSVEFIAGSKTKTRAALRTLYNHLPKHEHVYFIEGKNSSVYKHDAYGTAYARSWKNLLTNSSFILRGILTKSSLEKILDFDRATLQLFLKSPIRITVFPDEALDFDCDIFMSREQTFFAHPPHNTAAVVEYKHTTDAMIALYTNLESNGTKFDLQSEIKKILV